MEIVWIDWQRDRWAGLGSMLCRMMSCCHGSDILLVSVGTAIQILPNWILLQLDLVPLGMKKEEEERDREKAKKKKPSKVVLQHRKCPGNGLGYVYTIHVIDLFVKCALHMWSIQSSKNQALVIRLACSTQHEPCTRCTSSFAHIHIHIHQRALPASQVADILVHEALFNQVCIIINS